MSSKNLVILIGRVGKDPEIRTTANGKVASLTLATSEHYKDKNGEKKEQTDWHNIVFWGAVAEIVERYVKKGSLINVDGKIRTRSYDDKEGTKRYVTEVIANQLVLLGGKQDNSNNSATTKTAEVSGGNEEDPLPF